MSFALCKRGPCAQKKVPFLQQEHRSISFTPSRCAKKKDSPGMSVWPGSFVYGSPVRLLDRKFTRFTLVLAFSSRHQEASVCCSLHLRLWSLHAELLLTMGTRAEVGTKSLPLGPGCFFLLWPLFARAPRHWFLENFLLSAPGVQSVFFLLRSVGRRDLSAGPEQKKKTPPRVFFFAPAPGKGKGRRSPVGRRHGARAKKKTPPRVFFFCCGPGERQGKEKPRWAPARGQSKKKNTTQGDFFLLRPRGKAGEGEAPLGAGTGPELTGLLLPLPFPGAGAKKKNTLGGDFFFWLWPRAGAQRGFSFACFSPGPQQKKTPSVVFSFCSGPVPAPNGASPSLAFHRGRSKKKKKTPWVVFFFFAAAPRGRSLTHCGPGWRCLPLAGVVFFFAAAPPGPGWCFFFAVAPPGRSLTHGGLGRFRQGPGGVFFFAAAPPGLFRQ